MQPSRARKPTPELLLPIVAVAVVMGSSVACNVPEAAPVPDAESTPASVAAVEDPGRSGPQAPEDLVELPDAESQIAAAVQAAPPDLRDAAAVRAWAPDGVLVLVRRGSNGLVCLADDPTDDRFQASCYHEALEPYMARGRELRAEGVDGPDNLQRRHDEVDAGLLAMPDEPVAVYTVGGEPDAWDVESGELDESRVSRVYSVYVAGATEASTGLPTTPPVAGAPWIMRPGTPSSHVMVVPPAVDPGSDEE